MCASRRSSYVCRAVVACVLQFASAAGAGAPAVSLMPQRLGFFEQLASNHQSRIQLRSQDQYLVALSKEVAPPPPNVLCKIGNGVKGALASSTGFFQAAAAGGFAASIVFPIDMAKTRMQACAQMESTVASAARTYSSTTQTITKVIAQEGVGSLYRGLGPVLIGSAPEMAVQITAYEIGRAHLTKKFDLDPLDFRIQAAAGLFAGFCHSPASNVMEVLKVRGQVLGKAGGGLVGAIQEVGAKGMFKGLGASCMLHIPFSFLYFPTYSFVKDKLEKQGHPAFLCSLVAGLAGGVIAAAPTTPCDVVKTRMQHPNACGRGLFKTMQMMYVEEGAKSFFVGLRPRVGRAAPYLALSLTGYETLKTLGKHMSEHKPVEKWIAGAGNMLQHMIYDDFSLKR